MGVDHQHALVATTKPALSTGMELRRRNAGRQFLDRAQPVGLSF
jgi:hypothetical protein